MSKKLTQTFNGNKDKQIDVILRILWAIKSDDSYYFFEYGKDLLNRYFDDCKRDSLEEIKHLKSLVDNKNALIETLDK